jgi:hypothetical protein
VFETSFGTRGLADWTEFERLQLSFWLRDKRAMPTNMEHLFETLEPAAPKVLTR